MIDYDGPLTLTTGSRKSVVIGETGVASQSRDAFVASTLSTISVTTVRFGSDGMAIAMTTSGLDISETVLTLGASPTNVFVFALTLTGQKVAIRIFGPELVAITSLKIREY